MGIGVLGPLRVDGHADVLSPRDRVVLSALVVRAHEPVSTESLADALWGEVQPASWSKVVYGCVSRLRKLLGPAAIDKAPAGYLLTLGDDELDHRLFERLLERGREALVGNDPARASFLVEDALGLWRGRALADVEEWEPGRVEAARLEGLRMEAEELRIEAEVRLGHGPAVLERARALVAQAPLRERRWSLLATSLYQAGRQGEALGVVHRARKMLVDELGLDPGPELVELEQRLLRQDPSLSLRAPESAVACPYRGLLPYDAEDADSYFGREHDIAVCLRRLRDSGVLVVVGPSGVGKSSLVRAGVLAALVRSDTPVLFCTPGGHPTDSLVRLGPRAHQTLVVDQVEEAVTLCTDPPERERYFTALAAHVGAGGGLVLALRADHLGDLAPYPAIARLLEDGLHLLGPMREEDLRRAIEGPARRAGLRLEPGLVDLLVREVEGQPAGLPMLSHVLHETWARREGATLTIEGYKATGGIRHAVAQSAETVYDGLDEGQRSRLRSLLLRLVMPTEDGEPVRAKVSRERVAGDEEHRDLVEILVEARLLSIDGDSVQIAHEALVRVWPRLRGWLDDDVDGQLLFRHVVGAAEAWDAMGRPESELYRGTRLGRTLEWRDRSAPDLNDTENAFLTASAALSDAELRATEVRVERERRVNRRLRGSLAGVGVLLVAAVTSGLFAVRSADAAREQRLRAERAATVAEAGLASAQGLDQEDASTSLLLQLQALRIDASSARSWDNLATTLSRPGLPRQVHAGTGRLGYILSLAVSDDGRLVATNDPVDGVQLYEAASMAPVDFDDSTPTSAVAFSPDGSLLAAGVNQWTPDQRPRIADLPVRLYDLPSGSLSGHQLGGWPEGANVEYALGFSRDGRRLAAAVNRWDDRARDWAQTGAAMVWDVRRPAEPVLVVPVPDAAGAALSPDGRRLFTASTREGSVRVYDVDTGRLVRSTPSTVLGGAGAVDLDVSPDGTTLAVGTNGRVLLLDVRTLVERATALRQVGDVRVSWSHDGSMLLTTSVEGGGVVWDAATRAEQRRFAGSFVDGAFSHDDRTVLTGSGREMALWDVSPSSALLSSAPTTSSAQAGLDVSLPAPDGELIARTAGPHLWFVDSSTGQETAKVPTARTVWSHRWSPDSRWFLTTGPGLLSLWDPVTGRLVDERRYPDGVGVEAAFSPDGDRVHVHDRGGNLETLDRETLEPSSRTANVGAVLALLPDPRDGTVIALRPDGSVIRVDPVAGRVLSTGPAGQVEAEVEHPGALSPDGSRMVARHPSGVVRLLDTHTFEWVGEESASVWGDNVAYAPDGSQFASAEAGRVRLFDGRSGAYLGGFPLPAPVGEAKVAYRPDSHTLLVAARDGRTWTVDTRRSTWVELACRIAGRNLTGPEWEVFFPGRPHEATCAQWPSES